MVYLIATLLVRQFAPRFAILAVEFQCFRRPLWLRLREIRLVMDLFKEARKVRSGWIEDQRQMHRDRYGRRLLF